MKKRRSKKMFMLGVLLLTSSLFLWNCEQEEKLDIDDIQQSLSKKIDRHIVSGETFKKEYSKAFDIVSKLSKQSVTSFSRTDDIYSEEHDLYYTLNKVYIIEEEQYQQYSFLVKSSNQLENQFENYLLINYSDDSSKQYVITYEYNSPDKDSYDYVGIRELEGGNLYTSRIICNNLPELTQVTVEVCTYSNCTGTTPSGAVGTHGYGSTGCECGDLPNCSPPSKNCTTETQWVMSCGGTDNDPANDDDYNDNDGTDNGGGSSGNDDDDTDDGDIPVVTVEEETAVDLILECINGTVIEIGDSPPLSSDLIDLLENDEDLAFDINSFLQKNECSEESQSLAIDIIDAIFYGTDEERIASLVTLRADIRNYISGPYDDFYFNLIDEYYDVDLSDPYLAQVFISHFSMQCAILRIENPEWDSLRVYWEASKEMVHIALDLAGMVPVIGEVCDLVNGIIYSIEGDGVNATLSFAAIIPIAGWWATGAKYAKKTLDLTNGSKTTLKWIAKANNLIDFGKRGQLRRVLGITDSALQAHHIIPWANRTNDVVQQAAKSSNAFHMNEALNGIAVAAWRNQPNHNLYNQRVQNLFDSLPSDLSPDDAYDAVSNIIDTIRNTINSNPSSHLNDLIF